MFLHASDEKHRHKSGDESVLLQPKDGTEIKWRSSLKYRAASGIISPTPLSLVSPQTLQRHYSSHCAAAPSGSTISLSLFFFLSLFISFLPFHHPLLQSLFSFHSESHRNLVQGYSEHTLMHTRSNLQRTKIDWGPFVHLMRCLTSCCPRSSRSTSMTTSTGVKKRKNHNIIFITILLLQLSSWEIILQSNVLFIPATCNHHLKNISNCTHNFFIFVLW